jgi:hypothetical protein
VHARTHFESIFAIDRAEVVVEVLVIGKVGRLEEMEMGVENCGKEVLGSKLSLVLDVVPGADAIDGTAPVGKSR